ncbi:rod shape-determining protein RodA [Spirochaetia bacterium]|nr:rod shape-determining protein RodA [Spirochaetia bacterium]
MIKTNNILEIDFLLLLTTLALVTIGIRSIYSAGATVEGTTVVAVSDEYTKQIVWAGIGVALAIIAIIVDSKHIYNATPVIFFVVVGLLIFTLISGQVVNGSKSWLRIHGIGGQPSEFAKIATILFLARYLSSTHKKPDSMVRFLVSCLIVIVPMGLVLVQPDFGTALVFIPILLVMDFVAGVSVKYILFLLLCIVGTGVLTFVPLWQTYILERSIPALAFLSNNRFMLIILAGLMLIILIAILGFFLYKKAYFFWILYATSALTFSLGASFAAHKILKEYQIMRLIIFLNPEVEPRGAGWNIIQSMTAIGSGGLFGKGFLQGTQSHYRFLPQQSTDFIFSIFSEERGFTGSALVFCLFLLICLRLVRIMKRAPENFGCYISAGLASLFIFHFCINVGMTMGIMPITGIPLMFMSYGGSSTISALAGIGLALNSALHHTDNPYD